MQRTTARTRITFAGLAAALALGTIAAPAFAGKPTGGASSGGIKVAEVNTADGVVNQGDRVSFTFTGSYSYPAMSLTCNQGGSVVYSDSRPMYWPNPFNDPGIFTLSSLSWTSGSASCTAALKVAKRNGTTTVASLSFAVAP